MDQGASLKVALSGSREGSRFSAASCPLFTVGQLLFSHFSVFNVEAW
jgi:hypothetical protein